MAGITSVVTAPLLLLLSMPLALFALLTTTLTFWILLLRVSVVYAELIFALLRAYIVPANTASPKPSSLASPPRSPTSDHRSNGHRRQKSRSSSIGAEAIKCAPTKSGSFASLVGTGTNRDYEGIGGWRLSENQDEEALWMGMNARLELPAAPVRRHHSRSSTGGSQNFQLGAVSGFASPEMVRTPLYMKSSGHAKRRSISGTASPEGYFYHTPSRGSVTALTAAGDRNSKVSAVSFEDRRKSSSSSSTTSIASASTVKR